MNAEETAAARQRLLITLAALLEARDPLYRDAAHVIVDTGTQSAATLVGRVVAALERHGKESA